MHDMNKILYTVILLFQPLVPGDANVFGVWSAAVADRHWGGVGSAGCFLRVL